VLDQPQRGILSLGTPKMLEKAQDAGGQIEIGMQLSVFRFSSVQFILWSTEVGLEALRWATQCSFAVRDMMPESFPAQIALDADQGGAQGFEHGSTKRARSTIECRASKVRLLKLKL
jgi:hypothetical protein